MPTRGNKIEAGEGFQSLSLAISGFELRRKYQYHSFEVKDTFFAPLETHFESAPARQIYRIVKITRGVLSPKSSKSFIIPFMIYLQVTFRDLYRVKTNQKN